MYTRHVSINLRPGTLPEFKGRLKNKIVPLLYTLRSGDIVEVLAREATVLRDEAVFLDRLAKQSKKKAA